VLADSRSAYSAFPGYQQIEYSMAERQENVTPKRITSWSVEREVQPVSYSVKDYNPLTPSADSGRGRRRYRASTERRTRPCFDYPGEYDEPADSGRISKNQAAGIAKLVLEILQGHFLGAGDTPPDRFSS